MDLYYDDHKSKETLLLMNLKLDSEKVDSRLKKGAIRKSLLEYRDKGMFHFELNELNALVNECCKRV